MKTGDKVAIAVGAAIAVGGVVWWVTRTSAEPAANAEIISAGLNKEGEAMDTVGELLGATLTVVEGDKLTWSILWKNTGVKADTFRVGAWIGLYPDIPPSQWPTSGPDYPFKWPISTYAQVIAEPGVEQETVSPDAGAIPRLSWLPAGVYDVLYYVVDPATSKMLAWAIHKGELIVGSAALSAEIISAQVNKAG